MAAPTLLCSRATATLLACLFLLVLASTAFSQTSQITDSNGQSVISGQSAPSHDAQGPDGTVASSAAAKTPAKRTKPKVQKPEKSVSPTIYQGASVIVPGNTLPQGNGIKEFGAKDQAGAQSKQPAMFLSPEFRSPVNALTPADPIGRDPYYGRTAPGVSAIIHSGKNTEIRGVFSLPGSSSGTARPYGQPVNGGQDAPSGGVMLKQTF